MRHCGDDIYVCGIVEMIYMFAGTLETLEIAGMLINFHSGKFGYSILHNFSKGHAEFCSQPLPEAHHQQSDGLSQGTLNDVLQETIAKLPKKVVSKMMVSFHCFVQEPRRHPHRSVP